MHAAVQMAQRLADNPRAVWTRASRIDRRIRDFEACWSCLARRQLTPCAYSRRRVHDALAAGRPVIFDDAPVRVRGMETPYDAAALAVAITQAFPRRTRVRVRSGARGVFQRITVGDLMRRWEGHGLELSVTDLHIRGTDAFDLFDTGVLDEGNLLKSPDPDIAEQEMLTLIISSAGTFSDSHTDDPDGSNHCFLGQKLWLVWDTFDGLRRGLQDVERVDVFGRAAFDLGAFCEISGSRWFVIQPGHTLFLPGHLAHRVVTVQDYIGISSFNVTVSSYLRTVARWTRRGPLWAADKGNDGMALVDKITRAVTRKARQLRTAPREEQVRWGFDLFSGDVQRLALRGGTDWETLNGRAASAALLKAALPEPGGLVPSATVALQV